MWRMWNELDEQQRRAARTMFSADPYIEMGWGWWVESDGSLLCRRLAPAIKNWAAVNPWEAGSNFCAVCGDSIPAGNDMCPNCAALDMAADHRDDALVDWGEFRRPAPAATYKMLRRDDEPVGGWQVG